jgi:2-polyprenyl-3-methyl-5-hydroxy-6-metoxy-1,4-benzoquinol methylase
MMPGASLAREVQPEILDRLPADDPQAIRSRADLRWINAIMMQSRSIARALRRHDTPCPRTILDLGSGDGTLMLSVAKRLAPRWRDVTVTLLDQRAIVSRAARDEFAALQWHAEPVAGDVFDTLAGPGRFDVIVAKLFMHHFEGARLTRLLRLIAERTPLAVACEPRRDMVALVAGALTGLIGCNAVTRHDAVASVRAGFRDAELSAIWPDRENWRLDEWMASPFSHGFLARRRDAP